MLTIVKPKFLWIGYEESLKEYFSQFGKVDQLTILREADGRSRGFAFLTFDDPSSVTTVLGREHFLDGKSVGKVIWKTVTKSS